MTAPTAVYDADRAELRLPELGRLLDSAPEVTAASFAHLGPCRVHRVWLGRVEELSPSRSGWGPLYLHSWLDNQWPFHFDAVDGCSRCCDDAVQGWMQCRERVAPCRLDDPCHGDAAAGHCGMCRDAAWFERLFEQADQVDAVLQHGETRRSDLYVVRFSYLLRPS